MSKKNIIIVIFTLGILILGIYAINFEISKKSLEYEKTIEEIINASYNTYGKSNKYVDHISNDNYERIHSFIRNKQEESIVKEVFNVEVGFVKWYKSKSKVKVYLEYQAYDENNKLVTGFSGDDKFTIMIKDKKIYIEDVGYFH